MMAPKKKASRQKKAPTDAISEAAVESPPASLKVERRGDGVVVVEGGVKKIEQMAALDIAQLNSLNLPLPPPVIKPGERGLGLGSELTRPLHGNALLEELSKMRQEKFLTDLELGSKTKTFDVHKLVISSVSQYFREILAKDPNMKRLELPSLSPLGLANVITFAYLGRVHMSLYTIGCTVSAAATLQIPQLLKMCMDFLLAELNVQTCVYIWNIAAAYGLLPVCEAARRFVLDNFVQFSETPLFTQLTLEQISAFLQDDTLVLPSEVTAFQLAQKWLDFDATRHPHAGELLSHVRFETIPASELVSQIQPVPRMMMDPQCHRLLVDAMNYHLLPYQQNTLQSRRTQVRASQQTLLTIGGRPSLTERALSREVLWRDPREGGATWRHLTQLPAKSFNQCVAVMDGFLYVAGGEDQNDARNQAKHAVSTLSRYDPRFNTWLHLASMRQRRTHFSLAASGGRLFAIGGRNVEGLLATTESYVPSSNTWQMRAPMEAPRCCHSSATLPSGDILVTGGYINCAYSRSVACYSVETDTWSEKVSMETPRGWHCSATLGGKVYVVGGSQLGPSGERVDVLSMEVFSPESGTWSRAAPLRLGVSTAGLSSMDNKLFLLGGWNEAEKRYKAAVQKYDPATDSWSMGEGLPEPTVGVSCCALSLPPRHAPRRQQHRNTPSEDQQQVVKNRSRENSVAPAQTIKT
ncbi:kelch-like protein 31 [Synchiropus splendidus]|uniref:kelch-like protein 31 n=1 Tax=Synchiropus splendidus TaxID=270530 RepID=UPI00237E9E49|nr:kelch-like protein 31 [Synchiropus splendidus]XP_053719335.1 kelch-like protein 31 [Synchiropus splendidus]XP_053719336.1 kelch-like protein 31 [Synchiropus splendidus]